MVSLNYRRPYPGWAKFSCHIRELAEAIQQTGLIVLLERFSLKFVNLPEQPVTLNGLNIVLRTGQYELDARPIQLMTEIREASLIHVIQIISPAEIKLSGPEDGLKGVLLDMECIKPMSEGESWDVLNKRLDEVHKAGFRMFFDLLKPETLEVLEPEYEG